jgi:hypothetical protein
MAYWKSVENQAVSNGTLFALLKTPGKAFGFNFQWSEAA